MTSVDDDKRSLTDDFVSVERCVKEGIDEGDDKEEEDGSTICEDTAELRDADLPQVSQTKTDRSEDIHRWIKRYSLH